MAKRILRTVLASATMATFILMGAGPASAGDGGNHTQLIGGDTATEQYLFHASLQYKNPGDRPGPHRCGGALIAPQWVVTAAHCIVGRNPADFKIGVGSNDYLGGTFHDLTKFIVHPYYSTEGSTSEGDIALIRLASPSTVQPIASASAPPVGDAVRMIGWGVTRDGDLTSIPRFALQLDTIRLHLGDCLFGDDYDATPGDLCTARAKDGVSAGACNGDSGSPLLRKLDGQWRIIGVDSRSGGEEGCLKTDEVYTSTASYWAWITNIINGD